MAKSKLAAANEKIAEQVVDAYKKLKIRLSAAILKSRTLL